MSKENTDEIPYVIVGKLKKYGTKIEIINIIQGQKEENEIITNITKYLLDFMFDIELEENNENAHDNNFENSEEYLNDFEDND